MSTARSFNQGLVAAVLALLLMGISGCATNNPRDPLEPFNRGVYAFNDGLDTVVLKPIAQGYRAVLPQFVRTGIGNFFSNLDDITVIANDILQAKIPQAASDVGRFVINSTIGLLGLIDVATHLGLEKHIEDFGQTLGYWGIGSGPYLVLPLLGPSSFRDGIGRWVDFYTDVVWQLDHIRTRNQVTGVRAVDRRSRVLDTEKVLETATGLDEYAFIRDAYLQRRRNLVYDGNPPPEPEDDEPPAKPKTQVEPALKTVLVDQFGNVVAGGEPTAGGIAPILTEETSRPLPTLPKAPASERRTEDAPKAPSVSVNEDSSPETSARVETPVASSSPIVRVWLPSDNR